MASIRELQQQKKLLEEQKATKQEIKAIEDQIAAQEKRNADNAAKRAKAEKEALAYKKSILKEEKASNNLAKDMNKLLDTEKGKLLERLGVIDKSNAKKLQDLKTQTLQELRTKKLTKAEQQKALNTVKGLNAVRDLQSDVLSEFDAGTLENMSNREIFNKVLEKAELSEKQFNSMSAAGKKAILKQVFALKKGIQTLTEDDLKDMVDEVESIKDEFDPLIKKAKTWGGILKNAELRTAALKAGVAAIALSFAKGLLDNALELRQELGLGAIETGVLAAKVSVASTALKTIGGNAEEVKNFVTATAEEFGTIDGLTASSLTKFVGIQQATGLTGQSAAKLAKSIQIISGGSLETSLSTINTFKNLARAAGVAPKLVLEDVASDTESFAKFAQDGGTNIAKAAIEARKLGLNLSTVAGIAENLLDFESSIEKQLEASVLLGRQLNLDKARELALTGDLAGLAEEVKNQVGSQADFEAMNVVQRKALADSIGVSVADLGKMVAGEKTSAELAEQRAKQQEKMAFNQDMMMKVLVGMQGVQLAILAAEVGANIQRGIGAALNQKKASASMKEAGASVAGAAAEAGKSAAKVPVIGPVLALAALAAVGMAGYKLLTKKPPAMETGGIVTKSGMAEVHKGEAFSGTKNQMGFGADMKETNSLLQKVVEESRQLRTENAQLMNTLTSKVGEMAMSS